MFFSDEHFGAYPSYDHWAHRNLHAGQDGFASKNVLTPRGCFFEHGRVDSLPTSLESRPSNIA
jgi:hypothetical protein